MSPPGRPKGEFRGAPHEGAPTGFWWSQVPRTCLPGDAAWIAFDHCWILSYRLA